MAKAAGGKRLSFFVRDAKSPSLTSEEEVDEQLESVKDVAEAGVNLLRAFHAIHKASEAYINTLLALANSGSKAHPETVQVAGNLHQVALQMRTITDAHRKCVGKFSSIVTKTNEYSVQEKELLKHLLTSFTKKEKGIKKFVEKGLRDPRDLQEFYRAEMKDNVLQQKFRYKFFLDRHSEWLLSYGNLCHTISDILHDSDSETESSDSESEEESQRRRPVRTASASSMKSQNSVPERPPSSIKREPAAYPQKTQEWTRRDSVGNSSISVSESAEAAKHNSENDSKDQPLQLRKNNSSFLLPLAREETKSRTSSILKVRDHPQLARNSESSITDTIVNHAEFHLGDEEVADILSHLDNATASHVEEDDKETIKGKAETVTVDVHSEQKPSLETVGITVFPVDNDNVLPVPVVSPRKIDDVSAAVPVPAVRNTTVHVASKPSENNRITANLTRTTIADHPLDSNKTSGSTAKSITPLSPTTLQYVKPTLQENSKSTAPLKQLNTSKQSHDLSKKTSELKQNKLTPAPSIDSQITDWERGDKLVCTTDYTNASSERCLTASESQKLELLKVGSKGWIFVRNVDTLTTGWFPSIYVKKID
ncbi:hypothetical protein QR680_001826 [Steinernema hermaphroditum]|uniref:SH3 domain-containing protein n=1 Tax=Steinernema hermaphroditum TaxID=289476 RepID=A0AA39LGE1_9BILA|nr:hypothetical protein QR680_001826 [Steinernema hermaphroditum]